MIQKTKRKVQSLRQGKEGERKVPEPVSSLVPSPVSTVIQGNVRGLASYDRYKMLTLARLASEYKAVAIALTETHLKSDKKIVKLV